jgi:chorismate mutase
MERTHSNGVNEAKEHLYGDEDDTEPESAEVTRFHNMGEQLDWVAMAEKDQPAALALEGERKTIWQKAVRDILALESERKAIGEQIAAIKQQKIKGDLGLKIANFNSVLRTYKLGQDDRSEFSDTLREGFAALDIGEQLDWVAMAEKDQPAA